VVNDGYSLAIRHQRAIMSIHFQAPVRPARSEREIFGRQADSFLYQIAVKPDNPGILINFRPRCFKNLAAASRVYSHPGMRQDFHA
jgi:hypothetical protein